MISRIMTSTRSAKARTRISKITNKLDNKQDMIRIRKSLEKAKMQGQ
jgi:hypothetical protein